MLYTSTKNKKLTINKIDFNLMIMFNLANCKNKKEVFKVKNFFIKNIKELSKERIDELGDE